MPEQIWKPIAMATAGDQELDLIQKEMELKLQKEIERELEELTEEPEAATEEPAGASEKQNDDREVGNEAASAPCRSTSEHPASTPAEAVELDAQTVSGWL